MKQEKVFQIGEHIWVCMELYGHYKCIRPAEILSTIKENGNDAYVTVRYLDGIEGKVYECVSIKCIFRQAEVTTQHKEIQTNE